jgi:hypothetical protein
MEGKAGWLQVGSKLIYELRPSLYQPINSKDSIVYGMKSLDCEVNDEFAMDRRMPNLLQRLHRSTAILVG